MLLLILCFGLIIGRAIKNNEKGLNPYLLLISTIAALIIPSVSNDYKLSILIAPTTLVLCGLPEILDPKKKAYSILLIFLAPSLDKNSYATPLAATRPKYRESLSTKQRHSCRALHALSYFVRNPAFAQSP